MSQPRRTTVCCFSHVAVEEEEEEPWRMFGRALSSKVASTMQNAGNRVMLTDGRYCDNRLANLVHAVGHSLPD